MRVCGRSGRNMAFQRGPSDLFQVCNLTEKQNSADHVIHLKRKTTKTPCLKEIETPQ